MEIHSSVIKPDFFFPYENQIPFGYLIGHEAISLDIVFCSVGLEFKICLGHLLN